MVLFMFGQKMGAFWGVLGPGRKGGPGGGDGTGLMWAWYGLEKWGVDGDAGRCGGVGFRTGWDRVRRGVMSGAVVVGKMEGG